MIRVTNIEKISEKEKHKILNRNTPMKGGSFDPLVNGILIAVKSKGDRAVQQYTKKWDKIQAMPLLYDAQDFQKALHELEDSARDALSHAANEILWFHKKQIRKDLKAKRKGRLLGIRYIPHRNAAVYVPGGKALYPSSVLMGCIPASLAGVQNITVLSPPQADGKVPSSLLAACGLAGATSLYAAGGAQAIAAAVYGTETILPSSIVVGPGNNYVNKAKYQLAIQERIAIDAPAGPSEVLIIAEDIIDPEWLAADMLSQAEHGDDSPAILLVFSEKQAGKVAQAINRRLMEKTPRSAIKKKSLRQFGHILICQNLDSAIDFSNRYAPEHLQIICQDNDFVLSKIENAGSVFIGPFTPVAAGDYASGTNHILPTSGLAGVYSGLSVETFYKRFTYQKITQKGLQGIAQTIKTLSNLEGLNEEHGRSVSIRL